MLVTEKHHDPEGKAFYLYLSACQGTFSYARPQNLPLFTTERNQATCR